MEETYIEIVQEEFKEFVISSLTNNIKRLSFGVISTDDYVKGIMSTVTLHALYNIEIFTVDRLENMKSIINTIKHN